MVSAGKITGGLGNGLAYLSFDEKFKERRRHTQVSGVADGFKKGAKSFGLGLVDGITGIVTAPIRGAAKEGPKGFVKGVGKGVVGVAVKPVTGLLDLVGHASQGFKSKRNAQIQTRIRPPRSNAGEVFGNYSHSRAMGKAMLHQLAAHAKASLAEFDAAPEIPESWVAQWDVNCSVDVKKSMMTKKGAKSSEVREIKKIIMLTNKRMFVLKPHTQRLTTTSKAHSKVTFDYIKSLNGDSTAYQVAICIPIAAVTLIHLSYMDKSVLYLKAKLHKKATLRARLGKAVDNKRGSIFGTKDTKDSKDSLQVPGISRAKSTPIAKDLKQDSPLDVQGTGTVALPKKKGRMAGIASKFKASKMATKMFKKKRADSVGEESVDRRSLSDSDRKERLSDTEKKENRLAEYEVDCGSETIANEVVAAVQNLMVTVMEQVQNAGSPPTSPDTPVIESSVSDIAGQPVQQISIVPPRESLHY